MIDVCCDMNYKEVMRGEMKPDVYDGPECDSIKPYWYMYADGDMDGDYVEKILMQAKAFPPGTRIIVQEPCCPKCDMVRELCIADDCDFDWDAWTMDTYS
jgi:hypothetical protein